MFKNAIVRRPAPSMVEGITSAPHLGQPDYLLALRQHDAYIKALEGCGVAVKVLEAAPDYPDSCFVEDVAVLTPSCALITNPGAPTRQGEVAMIVDCIKGFYPEEKIGRIDSPGTLEGGDVMMVGNHFYIGQSARTNAAGARQMLDFLLGYGYSGSTAALSKILHLKTGLSYLENDTLLITGEFVGQPDFAAFRQIIVPPEEAYAANCIWVNGKVIVPAGFPDTARAIALAGYEIVLVDTSEFRKLDGGLSCLSLRF